MKRHLQCAEQQVSRSNLTKYWACHAKLHCKISDKIFENRWNVISNAGTIREWSDHDPRMIRAWSEHENANRNPPRKWGYCSRSPEAFSIVKYNVSNPILLSNIHQVLRLPQKVTLDLYRILPLPRKVTLDLHRILPLPRKVTRTVHPRPRMIRAWSEHENANRNPPRHRGYFSSSPWAFSIEKYNVSRPILHSNLHQIPRLPRKVTLALHEVLRLPRKVTLELHQVLHLPRKVTLELRKKPLTFTFIWRLIWGACAKGKCWFAKARESKSAPRKPRKLTCVDMCIRDLVLQICERFAKDVRKVRESWGVQVQEFPLFARSGLIGKCKAFLWKC